MVSSKQIHGSIKGGRRRARFAMAFALNFFEDLKNRIVVGNACGIEVRAVRQTRKLSPLGTGANGWPRGQSIANGLLILGRPAFNEFNNLQGDRAHEPTFVEFRRGVKSFPASAMSA
jgi:hypothetical protein